MVTRALAVGRRAAWAGVLLGAAWAHHGHAAASEPMAPAVPAAPTPEPAASAAPGPTPNPAPAAEPVAMPASPAQDTQETQDAQTVPPAPAVPAAAVEPIRTGGPNKPYAYKGATYVPETEDLPFRQTGNASWYGRRFHGHRTASGEVYNLYGMTAAHVTLPIPSYARVRNLSNGRSVIVRINDRGPFTRKRIIDLSYTAAARLEILHGVTEVEIERITSEAIRDGSWRTAEEAEAGVALPDVVARSRLAAASPRRTVTARDTRSGRKRRVARLDGPPAQEVSRTASGLILARQATPATETTPPALASAPSSATPALASAAPLPTAGSEKADTIAARGWWLQFATFQNASGAEAFYEELGELLRGQLPLLAIFKERALHKIQAGPFPSKEDAAAFAQTLRERLVSAPALLERK